MRGGDFAHCIDTGKGAVFIYRREVELRTPRAIGAFAVAVEFAGEQAARQRAPHHQAHLLVLQQGHDIAFQIAPGDGVIGLQGLEPRRVGVFGNAQRLHELPRLPVGTPGISHHALPCQIVERAHRFFDRRDIVLGMNLIKVDVIGLQPFQAARHAVHDVATAGADIVRPLAHAAIAFGGDHHVGASDTQILQRLPDNLLGLTGGIDIGGIEKIHPAFQRARDQGRRTLQIQPANGAEYSVAATECHGAETNLRHEQAGIAKLIVFHGLSFLFR